MNIGEKIKIRRKELDVSADYLAEKLGVSRSTIFRYENGEIEKIPAEAITQIAQILKTDPAYFLGTGQGGFAAQTEQQYSRPQSPIPPIKDDVEEMVNTLLSDLMDSKAGTLMLDGKPGTPQALEFLRQSIRANLEYAKKLNEDSEAAGIPQKEQKNQPAKEAGGKKKKKKNK